MRYELNPQQNLQDNQEQSRKQKKGKVIEVEWTERQLNEPEIIGIDDAESSVTKKSAGTAFTAETRRNTRYERNRGIVMDPA